MTLNEYQEKAMTTCMPSSNNFAYMLYNFLGEVGEMAEKVNEKLGGELDLCELTEALHNFSESAKIIRKQPDLPWVKNTVSRMEELVPVFSIDLDFQKELGDIEWQLNGMMTVLGLKADGICQQNLDKLASRQQRNVIDGNGDNR